MNSINRNRILVWLIIILSATNLATIGSFYYYRIKQTVITNSNPTKANEIPGERRTRFFREQLNLNDEQVIKFREINRSFNHSAKNIEIQLAQLREDMVKELGLQNPDKNKLNKIASDIGDNHRKLKQETITFYLEMKEICTPQQQEKLHAVFQSILDKESQVNLPRPGNRGGRWNKKN